MKTNVFNLVSLLLPVVFFNTEKTADMHSKKNINPAIAIISTLVDTGRDDALIRKEQAELFDGPYVQYGNGKVYAHYILQKAGSVSAKTDSLSLDQKNNLLLTVATDDPDKTFSVKLKEQLENEKSEYRNVNRQFVLSDIEGNFDAFRKLLQGNGVIDDQFNWTFGDGHLVLVGDFFDRGEQVTEILWLIYSLEDKAKAAGGHVHFILGNHEIMNLSSDLRYVQAKYLDNARMFNETYDSLYAENSELGKWLRTKNVVERIGKTLYAHGGISAQVNTLGLTAGEINKLARPFYADTNYKYPDIKTDVVMSEEVGPFWYRGYYMGDQKASPEQIDSTLTNFGVRHIVTGHTIVADTISVWYNNKVLDTDVHHAEGKSEALLIEGDKYYRVNSEGKKMLMIE